MSNGPMSLAIIPHMDLEHIKGCEQPPSEHSHVPCCGCLDGPWGDVRCNECDTHIPDEVVNEYIKEHGIGDPSEPWKGVLAKDDVTYETESD